MPVWRSETGALLMWLIVGAIKWMHMACYSSPVCTWPSYICCSYMSRLGNRPYKITTCPVTRHKVEVYKRAANVISHSLDICLLHPSYLQQLISVPDSHLLHRFQADYITALIFGPLKQIQHIRQTFVLIYSIIIHHVNIIRLLQKWLIHKDFID